MKKRSDIRNFYIDEEFKPVYDHFKKICEREGKSVSSKMREFIERYVAVHAEGNPQLQLSKFVQVPQKECFFCRGHFPVLYRVEFISGLVAPTCKECLERERSKGTFSTVKKVRGLIKQ